MDLQNPKTRRILFILAIILLIAVATFLITHGDSYFTRRTLREILRFIRSFGVWAPLVLISLIIVNTLIPPLPLPIPLIELSAGIVFGFGEGFLLVWFSQIISSFLAFKAARFFGRKFFKNIIGSRFFIVYREYLESKGFLAVVILRASMGAPFNVVSYLSGLTRMSSPTFLLATFLGTLPEAVIFTFIGSRLRTLHLSFLDFFIGLVIVGTLGAIATLVMIWLLKPKR